MNAEKTYLTTGGLSKFAAELAYKALTEAEKTLKKYKASAKAASQKDDGYHLWSGTLRSLAQNIIFDAERIERLHRDIYEDADEKAKRLIDRTRRERPYAISTFGMDGKPLKITIEKNGETVTIKGNN